MYKSEKYSVHFSFRYIQVFLYTQKCCFCFYKSLTCHFWTIPWNWACWRCSRDLHLSELTWRVCRSAWHLISTCTQILLRLAQVQPETQTPYFVRKITSCAKQHTLFTLSLVNNVRLTLQPLLKKFRYLKCQYFGFFLFSTQNKCSF